MKLLFVLLLSISCVGVSSAQDTVRIKALEERLRKLELRLAKLETRAAGTGVTPEAQKMIKAAKEHVAQESKNFASLDLRNAEMLYQRGSNLYPGKESKPLLDSVVLVYPLFNRAGCAQLYRAWQETGSEKERLLNDCIARFFNCYYLDGTQVGPLAKLALGNYYVETGRQREAKAIFRQIEKESPEAVDHDGTLLINKIE